MKMTPFIKLYWSVEWKLSKYQRPFIFKNFPARKTCSSSTIRPPSDVKQILSTPTSGFYQGSSLEKQATRCPASLLKFCRKTLFCVSKYFMCSVLDNFCPLWQIIRSRELKLYCVPHEKYQRRINSEELLPELYDDYKTRISTYDHTSVKRATMTDVRSPRKDNAFLMILKIRYGQDSDVLYI